MISALGVTAPRAHPSIPPEGTIMYEVVDPTTLDPITLGPGCRRYDLPSSPGARAWIVEIDAGHTWPSLDQHNERGEMVLVLDGDLVEGDRSIEAGAYVFFGPHSAHQPTTRTGVRLFGINLGEDAAPAR